MPRTSVVIPVYNGERTIRQTIESVFNQTFTDFELIVIDDGSKDATLDILASIQDPRLKVFSYPNAGVSASRNRGIIRSCGEFVAFLDADDLWTADKLEAQLKALEANSLAGLAYSWTDFIDENGQSIGTRLKEIHTGNVFAELLQRNFIGSGSNPLIYKWVFDETGVFDETLTHGEDWELFLRIAARYHFAAVPAVQVLYRITDYSATSNAIKLEEGSLAVIERAFFQAPKSLQHLKKRSLANAYGYLAARAIYGVPNQEKALIAAKSLYLAIRYNPLILRRVRFMLSQLFKIFVVILLPPRPAAVFLTKIKVLMKRPDTLRQLPSLTKKIL